MKITARLKLAAQIIRKGAWQPFNVAPNLDGGDLNKLARPYELSAWVMRAIKEITGPISNVPLKFELNDNEFDNPELVTWWKTPALNLPGWSEFIEASTGWLKLEGETFWILDDSWLSPFPKAGPSRRGKLVLTPPPMMKELIEDGELVGWRLTDDRHRSVDLLPEQVIQIKCWNPYNRWRGLAEYKAAAVAAEADYLAGKYNADLMRNNGNQGDYVIAKDGAVLTDDQRRMITTQLRAKRDAALRGDFIPIFLGGDIDIKHPEAQSVDTNLTTARIFNRHEVYAAFGVPPSLADVKQSYSYGKDSDYRALLINTCLPTGNKLMAAVTALAVKQVTRDVEAYLDWDDHPVMQEVRRERIDSAAKLWAMGVPLSAANEYLDMGLPEVPGWEIGYLPFSVAPTGSLPPDLSPDYTETLAAAPVGEMIKALQSPVEKAADPHSLAEWRSHMVQRRRVAKSFAARFDKMLMEARRETLANLDVLKTAPSPEAREGVGAYLSFNLPAWKEKLIAAFKPLEEMALRIAGQQLFDEIAKDDPFTMPPAKALEFLRDRENKLSGVADDVHRRVMDEITDSVNNGDSIATMASRLRDKFNEISKGRGRVIAMTETGAAYGTARNEAMQQSGFARKRWLTSRNPNVRPTHQEAEGQERDMAEPFMVGGAPLMYPSDPSGPPQEVINCHCVSVPIDEESNL